MRALRCAALAALMAAAALIPLLPAAPASAFDLPVRVSGSFSYADLALWNMTESGGVETNPAYKHYRMSGNRFLLSPRVEVGGFASLRLDLGLADLTAHSSEGETVRYDFSPAYGLGLELVPAETGDRSLALVLSADFLMVDYGTGETVRARHDASSSGGTVTMDWSEWALGVGARAVRGPASFRGGIRYAGLSAVQERRYRRDIAFTSDFEADRRIGLRAGADYALTGRLRAGLDVELVDRTLFTLFLRYAF